MAYHRARIAKYLRTTRTSTCSAKIARGRVPVSTDNRMTLRRLSREDLCLAGFGFGTVPTLLPRGQRIVAAARGEIASPFDD